MNYYFFNEDDTYEDEENGIFDVFFASISVAIETVGTYPFFTPYEPNELTEDLILLFLEPFLRIYQSLKYLFLAFMLGIYATVCLALLQPIGSLQCAMYSARCFAWALVMTAAIVLSPIIRLTAIITRSITTLFSNKLDDDYFQDFGQPPI